MFKFDTRGNGYGLPVVASNAGGNAELVTHELGGFVGPIGNSKVFADSLVRLAQDPISYNAWVIIIERK
jgi:glycosyltransferase involved in cell wall biosynthesis